MQYMEYHIIEENDKERTYMSYIPNVINGIEHDIIMKWLNGMDDFIPSYGYNNNISRLQKWYQKDKKYFCDEWKNKQTKWESFDYDNVITNINEKIKNIVNNSLNEFGITIPKINSCLINKYRSGNDYIPAHQDTYKSFGEYPTIIGISFGSSRNIVFKRVNKYRSDSKKNKIDFKLESGSIFIMGGTSQKYYTHEIPKTDTEETRYSLIYREFIN